MQMSLARVFKYAKTFSIVGSNLKQMLIEPCIFYKYLSKIQHTQNY